ncbi:MAG: hypothetical protein RR365_13240 [Bacteroides sp.]
MSDNEKNREQIKTENSPQTSNPAMLVKAPQLPTKVEFSEKQKSKEPTKDE